MNLRRAHLESDAHVVRADVVSYLRASAPVTRVPFSAALVDPPYGDAVVREALELLADGTLRWLSDDATVVAKHFWRDELPEFAGLERTRQKRFGETMLSFYTPTR
jgi:16S rRNA G966 N2-methylase RsmD